jgi:hypothetical protein
MYNQFKRGLPVLAVVAGVATVVLFAFLSSRRASALRESDATRQSAEKIAISLEALRPASPEDAAFRNAVKATLKTAPVASVWLCTPDGRIVLSEGCMARSTASRKRVQELATAQTVRVLDALPKDALSEEQRVMILTASAIQSEGEHNDVFHHLVRRVPGSDGSTVALIGMAYNASDEEPGLGWKLGVLGFFFVALTYWASLPLWVFLDARERRDRAFAWGAFVLVGNVVALLACLLAVSRPAERSSTI